MIYSYLTETDENLNVKMSLAESVKELDGGLKYDVKIKKALSSMTEKSLLLMMWSLRSTFH